MSEIDEALNQKEKDRKHEEWSRLFLIADYPGEDRPVLTLECLGTKLIPLDENVCDYIDLFQDFLERLGARASDFASPCWILTCPKGAEHIVQEDWDTGRSYEEMRKGLRGYPKVKIKDKWVKVPRAMIRFKYLEQERVNAEIRKHGVPATQFGVRINYWDERPTNASLEWIEREGKLFVKRFNNFSRLSRSDFAKGAADFLTAG